MSDYKIKGGTFNQSVFGDNATQKANAQHAGQLSAEVDAHLETLRVMVARLIPLLSPDEARQVHEDLEQIEKQARSVAPRKRWYEVSSEGVLKAATTVADLTGPVSTTLSALAKLLFP